MLLLLLLLLLLLPYTLGKHMLVTHVQQESAAAVVRCGAV
jgi:hypothetical protein